MIRAVFVLLAVVCPFFAEGVKILDTQVIGNSLNSCPSDKEREAAKINSRNAIRSILFQGLVPECGEGLWEQVGYLNMNDSEQSCPSPWIEASDPQRSCTLFVGGVCDAVLFPVTGMKYTRICGRATSYSAGSSPDAFLLGRVDGLSITHGSPRQHIFRCWTCWRFVSLPL